MQSTINAPVAMNLAVAPVIWRIESDMLYELNFTVLCNFVHNSL